MWKGWRLATLKTTCPINWQLCQSQRDGCRNQTESTINGPSFHQWVTTLYPLLPYWTSSLQHLELNGISRNVFLKTPKTVTSIFFQLKFSVQFFVLNRTALFCIVASFINPLFLLVIQNKIRFTSPPHTHTTLCAY